jgi:hypothetical protein
MVRVIMSVSLRGIIGIRNESTNVCDLPERQTSVPGSVVEYSQFFPEMIAQVPTKTPDIRQFFTFNIAKILLTDVIFHEAGNFGGDHPAQDCITLAQSAEIFQTTKQPIPAVLTAPQSATLPLPTNTAVTAAFMLS